MDVTNEEHGGERAAGRLLSLDVFRGLTIAGMILVNNPGPSGRVYWPLEHAAWHGWTPTDLIFPFFLFIVGVSITLAFARRVEGEGASKRDLYWKVLRRSALIYAFGFLLAGFPYFNLATIRLSGVLQRIAVCYFFAAVIFLNTKWRAQLGIAVALLLAYWGLSEFTAAPGYAAGDLSKEGSVVAFVDRVVLREHIWKGGGKVYDPEGLLSSVPAIATTLTGVLAGHWLRERREAHEKVAGLFVAGLVCVVVGWAWNARFPINKALWTSSYVVFTTGMGLQLLAFCYWLVDIKKYKRWALPFRVFGVNALAVFVLSGLAARSMNLWKMPRADGRAGNLQTYIYEHLFASWATPAFGSLLYALLYVLIWLGLMAILYRRRIFLKV
ncbi:MAG TPA: heparan-alpha-glucosaminide N-acetyltransferase domain-containing protein [Pyrinomonadaceae bacterium]|nr:heparan-alpha-glucosaminide N-acetyltransferase domain-containing protein [Pyrinomonadaceae bacterium]